MKCSKFLTVLISSLIGFFFEIALFSNLPGNSDFKIDNYDGFYSTKFKNKIKAAKKEKNGVLALSILIFIGLIIILAINISRMVDDNSKMYYTTTFQFFSIIFSFINWVLSISIIVKVKEISYLKTAIQKCVILLTFAMIFYISYFLFYQKQNETGLFEFICPCLADCDYGKIINCLKCPDKDSQRDTNKNKNVNTDVQNIANDNNNNNYNSSSNNNNIITINKTKTKTNNNKKLSSNQNNVMNLIRIYKFFEENQNTLCYLKKIQEQYQKYIKIKPYVTNSIYNALINGIFKQRAFKHCSELIYYYKKQKYDNFIYIREIKNEIRDIVARVESSVLRQDKIVLNLAKELNEHYDILFEYLIIPILKVFRLKNEGGKYKRNGRVVYSKFDLIEKIEIIKRLDVQDLITYGSTFRFKGEISYSDLEMCIDD